METETVASQREPINPIGFSAPDTGRGKIPGDRKNSEIHKLPVRSVESRNEDLIESTA